MGTLFVVATPLGNLEDLTPRAEKVLREVDLIACEDTRHTRKLLNHFGIATPTTSYHEHNEEQRAGELLERLRAGARIALVSDAGTPLLSDPGYRLVRLSREAGVDVAPIPGAAAAVAALSVSGLPTDQFYFAGFLPRRPGARKAALARLSSIPATLVFYLSPHALAATLQSILDELGDREAFLIREMTKLHESSSYGSLASILQSAREAEPRGEYTLVVAGAPESQDTLQPSGIDLKAYVQGLMSARSLSRNEAVKVAARDLGLPRNQVYAATVS